ncbi:hypothetical protein DFH05DRAFT_1529917 [Lentinula detonsa]|uniref:Uncharacterized protein n=1 Tax=Lentinula detonsa TaxID=2804962 RepID=A0A9W8NRS9_9AGAR|nr:hypothetical protein DFH05DRAFT_1529917 [Lentinula detonsa]
MSPLPLKIFLISLICIVNMVVVNTGPVARVQKTAADNLLAKRDGPLIGYLTFLKEEDSAPFRNGKFPAMKKDEDIWSPYPIYSHPGSDRFFTCKVFDTSGLLKIMEARQKARYYSTSAEDAMPTASSSAAVITPVHSSSKSELQMFVPKSLLTRYPPSVDCLIGEDEATPVADWTNLGLKSLPDQYTRQFKQPK